MAESKRRNSRNSSARCWRTATGGILPARRIPATFNFYMGKNTPKRKDYIMDRLVVPVEE